MSNQAFPKLLEEFESLLNNLNAPILKKLTKGTSVEEINSTLEYRWVPEEIVQLYSWHDGTNIQDKGLLGEFWIFRMGSFMSSARAMRFYKKRAGIDPHWDYLKFPIFESLGGELFLVDIDKSSSTVGRIYFYSVRAVDFDTVISVYDSLEALFLTIIDCFRQRAYFYNVESGNLEFNDELVIKISRKYNPNSRFWNIFKNQ